MFRVEITEGARQLLADHLAASEFPEAGIYIFQEPKLADVTRGEGGGVQWRIDRPKSWSLTICPFGKIPAEDILYVEGFPVCVALFEPTPALGIVLKAKDGQVFVEPIDA